MHLICETMHNACVFSSFAISHFCIMSRWFLLCSCGYLRASAICGAYLQERKVYFHHSQKQHVREHLIHNALSRSNVSAQCYKLATAALCYHMFPSCGKANTMKHRLCKEDCLRVKKTVCRNQLPDIFPVCSELPKSSGRRGRRCEKLENKKGK